VSIFTTAGTSRGSSKDDRRRHMIYRRVATVAMIAGLLLFTAVPSLRAQGPGFAGGTSAPRSGVQGPFREPPGALLPPSMRGSARRAIRQLRPMAQSRYYQSLKRPAAPGMSSQAKPEDTLQFPPAGAPAADAISSGTTVASYAAWYCATPRGACKLAQRQIVGDRCWCVARAGEYVNGTVASIGYAGN
jgi:hypothetical protein